MLSKYGRGFPRQLTHGTETRRHLLYSRILPPFGLEILFRCVLRLQSLTTSLSRLVHHLLFIELLGLVAARDPSVHNLARGVATYP